MHLNCGDAQLTASFSVDKKYLVQGLDTDKANLTKARNRLQKSGLYGRVTANAGRKPRGHRRFRFGPRRWR